MPIITLDMEDQKETFSDWDETETHFVVSLFDSNFSSPNINEILDYDAEKYNFDMRMISKKYCIDEIDLIKLINFVRKEVADYRKECAESNEEIQMGGEFIGGLKAQISSDEFMADCYAQSVLENDDYLVYLDDIMEFDDLDDESESDENADLVMAQLNIAPERIEELKEQYQTIMQAVGDDVMVENVSCSNSDSPENSVSRDANAPSAGGNGSGDDDIFSCDSCAGHSYHEIKLRDNVRTITYGNSLLGNEAFVANKIVIDVGCGLGILSMFAAKAGAKAVIGIENSKIIERTRLIVADNGYSEKITLLQGNAEQLCFSNIDGSSMISDVLAGLGYPLKNSADNLVVESDCDGIIIISEWMGHGLFCENVLSGVVCVRDHVRSLVHDSDEVTMFPSSANLYIEGMSNESETVEATGLIATTIPSTFPPHPPTACGNDANIIGSYASTQDRIEFWQNVYGFNMTRFVPLFIKSAAVQNVESEWCVTDRVRAYSIDCHVVVDDELDFVVPFQLKPNASCRNLSAFVISFDVVFNAPGLRYVLVQVFCSPQIACYISYPIYISCSHIVTLSTTPSSKSTYWKQVVCWLEFKNRVTDFSAARGDMISGSLMYKRCHASNYEIEIQWNVIRGGGTLLAEGFEFKQLFLLKSD